MRHELKHIEVDQAIMRKYSAQFDNVVRQAARKIDVVGPFHANDIEARRAYFDAGIQDAVEYTLEQMKAERRIKQQKIDSRHEYDRLSRMCGGR